VNSSVNIREVLLLMGKRVIKTNWAFICASKTFSKKPFEWCEWTVLVLILVIKTAVTLLFFPAG